MFLEDLADLKDRFPRASPCTSPLARTALRAPAVRPHRRPEAREILDALVMPASVTEWFLCGPFDLVRLRRETLEDMGSIRATCASSCSRRMPSSAR